MLFRPIGAALSFAMLFFAVPSAQAAPDGAALFRQRCQACHAVAPGQPATIAPNLSGVVGRKAAATTFNYSPALKASKLVWSKAVLSTFLSGPQQLVPGTRMVIQLTDPAERAAVIDFLAHTGH
jgi:cytochrome c